MENLVSVERIHICKAQKDFQILKIVCEYALEDMRVMVSLSPCLVRMFNLLFLAPDIWPLAFFFRSHATFETLRNLLAHGTRMSSSMYYKSSFSWFFSPPDFWLFPFLLIPCRLGIVDDDAASCAPHVILSER